MRAVARQFHKSPSKPASRPAVQKRTVSHASSPRVTYRHPRGYNRPVGFYKDKSGRTRPITRPLPRSVIYAPPAVPPRPVIRRVRGGSGMNVLPSQKYAKQGHIILGVHEDEDKIYLLDRYLLADMTTGYAILTYDKKRKEANEFEAPIEDERLQAWGSNKRISESEAKTKFAEKIMSLQKSPPLSPGEPAQGKQAEVTVTKLAEGVMVRRIEAPGEEPFRVNLMKQTNTLRSGKTYSVEYAEVVETEGFEGFEIRKKGDTIALHKLHFL